MINNCLVDSFAIFQLYDFIWKSQPVSIFCASNLIQSLLVKVHLKCEDVHMWLPFLRAAQVWWEPSKEASGHRCSSHHLAQVLDGQIQPPQCCPGILKPLKGETVIKTDCFKAFRRYIISGAQLIVKRLQVYTASFINIYYYSSHD